MERPALSEGFFVNSLSENEIAGRASSDQPSVFSAASKSLRSASIAI